MTGFLLVMVLVALLVRWVVMSNRFQDLERRIALVGGATVTELEVRDIRDRLSRLERLVAGSPSAERAPAPAPVQSIAVAEVVAPPVDVPVSVPAPLPEPVLAAKPRPEPMPSGPSSADRLRGLFANDDWEALLGGSLLNKVGAVVLVIGIALFLAYSFGRMTALGRASLALSASATILGAGIWAERRAHYRIFARGLIGAGWAALYATAYAIYALPAARIIEDPLVGSIVLLLVAAGMIGHSLRYRSQGATAIAYFAAFAALAATPSTPFAVAALVPLAASLLYLSNRFQWNSMALFGLTATYATCIARGSSDAPLASTQSLFLTYWLLFEAFDLLRVRRTAAPGAAPQSRAGGAEFIAPLNAAAFLALSYLAWSQKAPELLWLAAAYGAALYLTDAIARALLLPISTFEPDADLATRLRQGSYEFSLALSAVLTALAIVGKVPGVWTSVGLAVEAELLYLAGIRFRAAFLRGCGMAAFAFSLGRLATGDTSYGQSTVLGHTTWNWTPPALFHAFLFYVNRALKQPNMIASSMAAALAAAVLAAEMPARYVGASWLFFALALLELGLRKRLLEFRIQAYALASAGAVASGYLYIADHSQPPWIGLALTLAAAYTCALRSRWNSGALAEPESSMLAGGASAATAALAAILIWNTVPAGYVAMAWILLALVLFEAGNRTLPRELRTMSWAVAALGGAALVWTHADQFFKFTYVEVWASYLVASLAAWAMAGRAAWLPPANLSARERSAFADIMSAAGAFAAMAFLWLVLPDPAVSMAWAALGVAVSELFGLAGTAVLALTVARTLAFDLGNDGRVLSTSPVIAALYFMAYRLSGRLGRAYLWTASATVAALLYASVSGGLFTVALGLEGLALLGAGFGLRERILRLQGLALLLACILKLFVYDLRNLETVYRILSFIVLGLIMLCVSWIYTRFREHIRRLL